ncbi:CLUMA_CG016426, isoform A [Clunio marinus]|uniref:CLUMA_CG016426, isoform A n=1 Tax=Clunio marinus TaxID=568069 RepID=A0A1J1ISR3_9DIPT|nr:CLUMA_CG016426, isoform A [Clunio marinus]
MSSIQEKNHRFTKEALEGSISSPMERINCAAYPKLGLILSKDSSFIHLLDGAMNSSRKVIQKPVNVLVIPFVQVLCVAMAFCVKLIRKLNGGVSFTSLDKFITEINQLKSKHHSRSFKKNEIKAQTESTKYDDEMKERLSATSTETSNESKIIQKVVTFASVALVYVQFTLLIYLLGYTQLRAGFIFLLVCAATISYLILKMSFMTNIRKEKRISRRQQKIEKIYEALNSPRSGSLLFTHLRLRSREKENCLTKVKLL